MKAFTFSILLFSLFLSCQAQEETEQLTIINDLPYYTGAGKDEKKHKLNLILPKEKNVPMLIWLHGGAWAYGGRTLETDFAKKIAESGIAVAAVSYRLSPAEYRNPPKTSGIQHPEHIKDVAAAFSWIYDHATTYGYDRNKIFISGYSSGAHLSTLLAMDPKHLSKHSRELQDIAGVIPVSGTFDIPNYFQAIENAYGTDFAIKHVNGVFGSDDNFLEASPTTYIKQLNIPMLVLSDGALAMYSRTFEKALKEHGKSDVHFSYYHQYDHGEFYDNLSKATQSKARNELIQFIQNNSKS